MQTPFVPSGKKMPTEVFPAIAIFYQFKLIPAGKRLFKKAVESILNSQPKLPKKQTVEYYTNF